MSASYPRWPRPGWLACAGLLATVAVVIGWTRLMEIDTRRRSAMTNASCRAYVGAGERVVIGGFIIQDRPQTVLIRVSGPSLATHGLIECLRDPRLRVVRSSDGAELVSNDSWRDGASERFAQDLRSLAPADPREPACVLKLAPGAYASIVESADGVAGVALLEIYTLVD